MGGPLNESEMRALREEAQRHQRTGPERNQEHEFAEFERRLRELETKLESAYGTGGVRVNFPVISGSDDNEELAPSPETPEMEFTGCENGVETIFIIRARRA